MTEKQKYMLGNLWRILVIVGICGLAFLNYRYNKTMMCPQCRRNFREVYLPDTASVCPYCNYDFKATVKAYEDMRKRHEAKSVTH